MHLKKRIANALLKKLLPPPVQARHAEYSMLFSADDDISRPSPYLLSIALQAVQQAQHVSLAAISARMPNPPLLSRDLARGELQALSRPHGRPQTQAGH